MRNLTDTEIEVLAPRVQTVAETAFVNFKKLLKQPEYEDLAAAVDMEHFKLFLMNNALSKSSKSLQGFKSIEVDDMSSNVHVSATVCFAFEPTGKATSLTLSPNVGSYGIGAVLDRQVGLQAKISLIEDEHLWVYLDTAGPGEANEFANSIISRANLCPEDYCLLFRIDFKFKI